MINNASAYIVISLHFLQYSLMIIMQRNSIPCFDIGKMKGSSRVNIFISLLVLSTVTVTLPQKIHQEMNRKERAEVFLSTNGNVPDYEIVPIHWPRVQKRDAENTTSVRLKAFGDHIKLWLNPTDGVLAGENTPIYVMRNTLHGPKIVHSIHGMRYVMPRLYEDLAKAATLAVNSNHDGRKKITGVIGYKNLAIRPIPQRLMDNVTRYRRFSDDIHHSEYDDYHYHIVYKITPSNKTEPLKNLLTSRRIKRSIPSIVYPEILVIVDYKLYGHFHQSIWEILPYLLSFWNGVDMRYRNLENPRYRLNIAGILLAEDDSVLGYIKNNRYDDKYIFIYDALADMGKWLFKQDKLIRVNSYDVAITMTMDTMCVKSDEGDCVGHILGIAHVSGTCEMDTIEKSMRKTILLEDRAAYASINPAAHELAHSLGVHHDEADNGTCSYSDGYIMAPTILLTKNSFQWSPCSLKDFRQYLENTQPQCLYNKPNQGAAIPRYLPGRVLDANAQCKLYFGTKAANIDRTICQELLCVSKDNSREWVSIRSPAADGANCGHGKLCLNGRCISERGVRY